MKIGRLFIGKAATNEEHVFTLASWARADNYWRWTLRLHRFPQIRKFRWGPGKHLGERYFFADSFGAWMTIPFVGSLSIHTQPPPLSERIKKMYAESK